MTSGELKHRALVEQWAEQIGQCRTSGKRVGQWCEENHINIKTYYYWERKCLAEYDRWFPAKQGNLVKIDPAELPSTDTGIITVRDDCPAIEVGKVRLILPPGTDAVKIAEIIAEINRHA